MSDNLNARMEALVRAVAAEWMIPHGIATEAKAIVAELPNPDEQYARDLITTQGWSSEPVIGSEAVVRMIAQARRDGRTIAAEKRA